MRRAGLEPFGGPIRTKPDTWANPGRWQREAVRTGKRIKIFSCSMSDFFHVGADQWRAEAWDVIRACPDLIWQILTKRHDRIADHLPSDWGDGWPNVWLGITVERQDRMARLDTLLQIPAVVRWVSAEPLLGPLDFCGRLGPNKVQWVIDGCEQAGKKIRRPMDLAWCRAIRDQCEAAGVAYWHKQYYAGNQIIGDGLLDGKKCQHFPNVVKGEKSMSIITIQPNEPDDLHSQFAAAFAEVWDEADTPDEEPEEAEEIEEPNLLQNIAKRLDVIKTGVQALIEHYTPALFVYGPPGHGKSHAIMRTLDAMLGHNNWQQGKYITAKRLVMELAAHPDKVHFFDDTRNLFRDSRGLDVLLPACGAPNGRPRMVSWKTAQENITFPFSGGIIFAANHDLRKDSGPMGALASRLMPLEWRLSKAEVAAMIWAIAAQGGMVKDQYVTPDECIQVASFLFGLPPEQQTQIELRFFCDHALPAFAQWRQGHSLAHWQDVIRSKLRSKPVVESRADRLARERQIAVEVRQQGGTIAEQLARWKVRTGLNKDAYYARLREAGMR